MTLKRRSFLLGLTSLPLAQAMLVRSAVAQADASPAANLITAARAQIGVTLTYDGAYQSLTYPNGDITRAKGVCTDVIIRAYRDGLDLDLQKSVHEDMRQNFARYPEIWGLTRTDRNIDHRRVPNLETFLTRQNTKLDLPTDLGDLSAGDLLTMRLPPSLPHIAIVTDKTTRSGMPYIIHNIGAGTHEAPLSRHGLQDLLQARFRYLENLPA